MSTKIHIDELTNYVNAASDLADAIKSDIINNDGILTKETILKLNEFVIAAKAIEYVTDALNADRIRLN